MRIAIEEQDARARAAAAARDAFVRAVLERTAGHNLTRDPCLPNTAMLLFEGVDGRTLLPALDMAGIEASQGSACSAGAPEPPEVLTAMGLDDAAARRCVRFSVAHTTSIDDAEHAGSIVADVVTRLRDATRRRVPDER